MNKPPEKKRVFFALRLSEKTLAKIARAVKQVDDHVQLPNMRWVPKPQWHITLRFLGSLPVDQIDVILQEAQSLLSSFSPFEIEFKDLNYFPLPRKPKILVLTVETDDPLLAIVDTLEQLAIEHGLDPETRNYRPHITLARLKAQNYPQLPEEITFFEDGEWITEIALMHSQTITLPDGQSTTTYHPLGTIPLRGSGEQ